MKKYSVLLVFVLSLTVSLAVSQEKKEEKKEKPKEVTITGEVTDIKCLFNGMKENSDDHKQCATDCIKGGLPVGIMEEKTDKLYIVVPKAGMKGANEELSKYAEKKVKLTGMMMEKYGVKMIAYTKVEEAK
ncbi:MAG TPA: hypothetical protein VGR15_06240 [Bacteroidota bacterium]|nr:hypothetical protein [Bacteroidota bacterium]